MRNVVGPRYIVVFRVQKSYPSDVLGNHGVVRWLTCPPSRSCLATRSAAPAKFGAEQICAIIAITCEPPSASDRPITQWSQQEVADEAMRRGIVDSISQRSVGRFFKRVGVEAASHPVLADVQAG